jgi:rhodanese-related sulfurtransferase
VAKPVLAAQAAAPVMWLPEVIEARALATALMDAPGLYTVIDVRAAWQYAEYHVPGATQVDPGAVAGFLATVPAHSRVVLVDRDGTVAYSVAGAVLGSLGATAPSIRVLSGGTAAYWDAVELGDGDAAPAPAAAAHAPTPAPAAPAAQLPASALAAPLPKPATKPVAKKRNAGC